MRDWLASLGIAGGKAAGFDTRIKGPAVIMGAASKGITRGLRDHGFEVVAKPESFFVTKDNRLRPGEELRAVEWGEWLAATITTESMQT